jgi:hypothetical protein
MEFAADRKRSRTSPSRIRPRTMPARGRRKACQAGQQAMTGASDIARYIGGVEPDAGPMAAY